MHGGGSETGGKGVDGRGTRQLAIGSRAGGQARAREKVTNIPALIMDGLVMIAELEGNTTGLAQQGGLVWRRRTAKEEEVGGGPGGEAARS